MPVKKLKSFLDEQKVKYISIRHSLAYTAQEIAASAHIHGRDLAKTVIVRIDGETAMAVLPANARLDRKKLQQALDARAVELAEEREFKDLFPECALGAMPPFGNLYDMAVYVDTSLTTDEHIAFNAGSHTELIQLSYADFQRLVKPRVVSIAAE
jgi:Ala-tRNA(Pro) deacylase